MLNKVPLCSGRYQTDLCQVSETTLQAALLCSYERLLLVLQTTVRPAIYFCEPVVSRGSLPRRDTGGALRDVGFHDPADCLYANHTSCDALTTRWL
jgi:hypothetical protein